MTINRQFDDVDAHSALIRVQAAFFNAEHQGMPRWTSWRLGFGNDSW